MIKVNITLSLYCNNTQKVILILLKTFALGYRFSQVWPKQEPYLVAFPQTTAVKLADMSLTCAPIIALFTAAFQLKFLGYGSLNLTLAMSLLILSIPLHAFYVLGRQAEEKLPAGLQSWYKEIETKVKQQALENEGKSIELQNQNKAKNKLTYMDLAQLLKSLFERT